MPNPKKQLNPHKCGQHAILGVGVLALLIIPTTVMAFISGGAKALAFLILVVGMVTAFAAFVWCVDKAYDAAYAWAERKNKEVENA